MTPGPLAERTFDAGFKFAAVSGIVGAILILWLGPYSVSVVTLLFVVLLFPVYLLAVALVLGIWLGFETDSSDLRPASDQVNPDPWKNWPW